MAYPYLRLCLCYMIVIVGGASMPNAMTKRNNYPTSLNERYRFLEHHGKAQIEQTTVHNNDSRSTPTQRQTTPWEGRQGVHTKNNP